MKARKKGDEEWKEYKEVFDQYGIFQGLETAGYTETAAENFVKLGGVINPDDEFQASSLRNSPDIYVSKVLPLECFDLWTRGDEAAEKLLKVYKDEKGQRQSPHINEWGEFRNQTAAMAMQGLLANPDGHFVCCTSDKIARMSVACADALIKELKENKN